jgi:hypothetical protein
MEVTINTDSFSNTKIIVFKISIQEETLNENQILQCSIPGRDHGNAGYIPGAGG